MSEQKRIGEGPAGSYPPRALAPAHPELAMGAGVPAQLASENYGEALARVVCYWGYPAVDTFRRTSVWSQMKAPGATLGLFPGAPKNTMGYLDDHMSPAQRHVVTPNSDTIYGAGFADLGSDSAVIQTPAEVPEGHYWTIQIVDLFTTVTHQLGSASGTRAGKFLLVGPTWNGQKPDGFVEVLRSPTNIAGVFARSFAAHTEEAKARARAVLNQMGMLPLAQDRPGRHRFDCEASARNKVFPPGLSAEKIATDPDMLRARPVNAKTFWDDLKQALGANPVVGGDDAALAAQARTLLALRDSSASWRARLDRVALTVDLELHAAATYHEVGVDAGNGWQRQENGGRWGTDWFSRAQASVVYIYVNDVQEAIYFIRGTDDDAALLQGRYRYTMTFPEGALPPVDRRRGGFWSLSMYDQGYYMMPNSPNGRTNIGTVSLDANELEFGADGSLTIVLSREPPSDAPARKNWLPAPDGQFALLLRTYVPTSPLLEGSYTLPGVARAR